MPTESATVSSGVSPSVFTVMTSTVVSKEMASN